MLVWYNCVLIVLFVWQFGKGLYFADLVSKSAQYCCVDRDNPVGLMLLSEVALGDMYELKKAMVSFKASWWKQI